MLLKQLASGRAYGFCLLFAYLPVGVFSMAAVRLRKMTDAERFFFIKLLANVILLFASPFRKKLFEVLLHKGVAPGC